ncbi:MAG: single-stranded-DNA-specific exonuclease RecJ, partial [Ardenticatenia bacterium]|nr:single-stranded-DNA-specific exonuclease RecJ [Ardenticatenia bacterium]
MAPTSKRWHVADKLSDGHFGQFPDHPRLMIQILHNRGVTEPDGVRRFLSRQPFGNTDPFQLKGMTEAVARLRAAVQAEEPIAVYGDYDADGVTATALMTQTLTALGARVRPYIPDRFKEGYGLNVDALTLLASEGVRLVVTVDCGVRSVEEVAYGRDQLSLDLIVTDHHGVGPQLPSALAVINPKQLDCVYPFKQLAGVGVAFKLAQALFAEMEVPSSLTEEGLLDLVALGTVADVAPLVDENRDLVARGLQRLNTSPRLGIRSLLEEAGVAVGSVDGETVGFKLGPRLNAAGRVGDAQVAYELLVTEDAGRAAQLAAELDGRNRERQDLTIATVEKARQYILADRVSGLLYLIADPSFHLGVVGLVAGRLSEEFYLPILVARQGETHTTGSGRSIPEFHITRALDECSDLLERYGGHSAAAGFTVKNENLLALQTGLLQVAARKLADKELEPWLEIDAELNLRAIDRRGVEDMLTARSVDRPVDESDGGLQIVDCLGQLGPFGPENPAPLFACLGLCVTGKGGRGA